MDAVSEIQTSLLGPIVTQWVARKESAKRSKDRFDTIARLCRQFYGSSAKAMWEDDFRKEFFPTLQQPQFKINLNKAFELVAQIGPNLFWQNPERKVQSYRKPDQVGLAQLLGVQDPEMLQQVQMQQQMEEGVSQVRNNLISIYLDYAQNEQPTILKQEAEQCINDLLLTGLGLMWTESYVRPGTGEFLTQNVFGSVDELLIDPDSKKPDWSDARWISREHYEPVWMVERRFGYPPGYLAGRGTRVSAEFTASREPKNDHDRYCDMMEWTEIWSRGGIGARIGGVDAQRSQFLDQLVGDNVYLCVTPGVPHPLNIPPNMLAEGSLEAVKEAVRWRTSRFGAVHEVWKDNRWPVAPLKSYTVSGSPWPLAPLASGLGYLISMNVIMVAKLSQAWDRRRDIFGVASDMRDTLMSALKSDESPAIIPISHAVGRPLNELIQRYERGDSNDDLLDWMTYLGNEFAKNTGLMDIHYGMTQTQSRISGDIDLKNRAASIRPEKMRADIIDWVNQFSTSEMWLACQYVTGQQLLPLVGQFGAMAWDQLVKSIPFEQMIQQMSCFIDSKDLVRPDNARDLDGLNMIAQPFLQAAQMYAQLKGDPSPLNGFLQKWMEAMDLRDTESLMFGSFAPEPDPAAQQMQQYMFGLQAKKLEADAAETQAKTIGRLTDTQFKMRGVTPAMLLKMQQDELKFNMQMQQDQLAHLQDLVQNEELFQQTLKQLKQKTAVARQRT